MQNHKLTEKLMHYIDAGFPFIYIKTFEDMKADDIIAHVARTIRVDVHEWDAANRHRTWDVADGRIIKRIGCGDIPITGMLYNLTEGDELENRLIIIRDFHHFADDIELLSALKSIANKIINGLHCTVIFISTIVAIPEEIENFITVFDVRHPSDDEIKDIITGFVESNALSKMSDSLFDEMRIALRGLSEFEINNILALSYSQDGKISKNDISIVHEQKRQIVKKSGNLEMIDTEEGTESIGGLDNLKLWLNRKATVFQNMDSAKAYGVDTPRGVLMVGVPGCGKSLSAKAAAKLFKIPLLRLDMGRLLGKYVGESEANMRKAIALAEAISPCVLWIDELEKAFAGIGGDGGGAEVTTRLLGNFLTWMQEKKSPTFVIATANSITKLPPEFMRKGRFDEIFYIGLPNEIECKKIFEIHIGKRRPSDLTGIDTAELAKKSSGYCGADIEGIVKDAIEESFVEGRDKLTTDAIKNATKNTTPLSKIMEKEIASLERECESRNFKKASKQ